MTLAVFLVGSVLAFVCGYGVGVLRERQLWQPACKFVEEENLATKQRIRAGLMDLDPRTRELFLAGLTQEQRDYIGQITMEE